MRNIAICAAGVVLMLGSTATANPLDPNDPGFTSLGTAVIGPGMYNINTSGTPTLSQNGTVLYTGTVSNGTAVFDFDNLTISAGASIHGMGTLPVALLSKGNLLDQGGFIDVSANVFTGTEHGGPGASNLGVGNLGQVVTTDYAPHGPPNYYNIEGGNGGGSFGGIGGTGSSVSFFNPDSGNNFRAQGGTGGSPYADLLTKLQGGSAGGGGGPGGGLGGGGALELGAVGAVSITGGINANGGSAFNTIPESPQGGLGGGSGGGILIHGDTVTIGGLLSAAGGIGGPPATYIGASGLTVGYGGEGSGGEIVIQTTNPFGFSGSLGLFDLAGGGDAFINGVQVINSVPEPASVAMLGTGLVGVIAFALRSRRSAALRD